MSLFLKKPISTLMAESAESEKSLKRTLTAGSLIALGIGAIIGAGLFVRTAAAAAQNAGPLSVARWPGFVMQNFPLLYPLQAVLTHIVTQPWAN